MTTPTFDTIARRLDTMGAQLAAFRAMKGHQIPALNEGGPPKDLRVALVPLHEELRDMLTIVRTDPTTYGPLVPDLTRHTDTIEALLRERYPTAADTSGVALEALEKRLTVPIIPKKGADGR